MDRSRPALPVSLEVLREYWPGYSFGWDPAVRVFFAQPPGAGPGERLEDAGPEGLWKLVRADAIRREVI